VSEDSGSRASLEGLTAELHRELRRLAAGAMRGERSDHTLQPTALVNEAYLRLANFPGLEIVGRSQFLALAARVMRQVLVDHARGRRRDKRGGGALRVTLGDAQTPDPATPYDLLALDEALERLARVSEQQVRIVELRYLAGLSVEEVAAVLDVSPTTVKRDAAMAKAWLYRELVAGERGATGD
jgi:RNA polymerase sigma factor (TIGR02999 family)